MKRKETERQITEKKKRRNREECLFPSHLANERKGEGRSLEGEHVEVKRKGTKRKIVEKNREEKYRKMSVPLSVSHLANGKVKKG